LKKYRKAKYSLTAVAAASVAVLLCASNASAASWQLENDNSGKCLAVAGASTANAAGVIQWTCNGGSEQQWNFVPASGTDEYTLHNGHSGQCLAIGSASTAQGAKAIQWPCNGHAEQTWKYVGNDNLINVNSGLCLGIPGGTTANAAAAEQLSCNNSTSQSWIPG
jgi:hypothetical protein